MAAGACILKSRPTVVHEGIVGCPALCCIFILGHLRPGLLERGLGYQKHAAGFLMVELWRESRVSLQKNVLKT